MAITANGVETSQGYSAVSTSGALAVAVGGTLQTGVALMIAVIGFTVTTTTPATVTSITDDQGNTWQKYTSQSSGSGWHTANTVNGAQKGFTLEVWYTKSATIGTTLNVTINHNATIDAAVACFSPKFLGYNVTNPFDANGVLPKSVKYVTPTNGDVTGISTNTSNIYPVYAFGGWGTAVATNNVSFNGVSRTFQTVTQKNASEFVKCQFAAGPVAASAYSGVSFTQPSATDNTYIIALVLTSDSQVNLAARPYATLMG